jgi:hypothetical protein
MPWFIVTHQSVKEPLRVKPATIDQRLTPNLSNHPIPSGGISKSEKASAPTKPERLVGIARTSTRSRVLDRYAPVGALWSRIRDDRKLSNKASQTAHGRKAKGS